MTDFDVVIIGAGPAGLTAALFAARRGLRVMVVSQDIGGQASTTGTIENYPGFDLVDGFELMKKFQAQAEKYGAQVVLDEVQGIAKTETGFVLQAATSRHTTLSVIFAQGLTHKHLDVPGEEKFIGRGVSYYAAGDAPRLQGRPAIVIGGGNSAMDAALLLANFSPSVTIINRNAEFRGEKVLIERMNTEPKIRQLLNATTKEILGDEQLTGVMIECEGAAETIPAEGVFVEIGFTVNPGLIKDLMPLDQRNQIIVDPITNGTSVPGVFAAGDVTTITEKQVVVSAGEGAKAALAAHQYLQAIGAAKRTGTIDWGVSTPMRHVDQSAATT